MFDIVRGAAWPAIYPGRALRNDFFAQWHGKEEALAEQQKTVEPAYVATTPTTSPSAWCGPARASTWCATSPRRVT